MPKPFLREPFATLESDIIETMIGGLHQWRSDLSYPESHSDMAGCIRAVIRKYEVKLRPVPLETKDIVEPDPVCGVCGGPLGDHIMSLDRSLGREKYAHPGCIQRKANT